MGFTLVPPRLDAESVRELSPSQRRVIEHRGGPLLVLAGPGTGKTTTVVETVAARLLEGTSPDNMLVLTFSRKSALDLRERVTRTVAGRAIAPTAMTIHGFCYDLLRRHQDVDQQWRLLTAPEQDARVRDVLDGWTAQWPHDWQLAAGTRGFVAELRSVMAKVRQLGWDPSDLEEFGAQADRPEWVAAGKFMEEYNTVTDFEGVLDYAELVHRCRLLLQDPHVGDRIRQQYTCVVIDEYQDIDPAQAELLGSIVGPTTSLIAFADPDQAVFGFRGAQERAVAGFRELFGTHHPAEVTALEENFRMCPSIAEAVASIADRLPGIPAIAEGTRIAHRHPIPVHEERGRIDVWHVESESAQAEWIADELRRAHLEHGIGWDQMAVLVRSGHRQIPPLARGLVAAGVPVEIAGDEIALASEPAVMPLLLGLKIAAGLEDIDTEAALRLLMSPMGRLDAVQVRALGRLLRRHAADGDARQSGELIAHALSHPDELIDLPDTAEVSAVRALGKLLADVQAKVRSGADPHTALWALWNGTSWPQRLVRVASEPGASSRSAHRDLDAVVALFAMANRRSDAWNKHLRGFIADVEHQQIPADLHREADMRGVGVRVMTAHRSKGLEWDLVVVAGVQDGMWPTLRRQDALLEAERMSAAGIAAIEPLSAVIAQERRLFLVACSRARQRLIVTAVASGDGDGDQPSRFLDELGIAPLPRVGAPARPLTLVGLVSELRRTSVDPNAAPELRAGAVARLAALAQQKDPRGRPLAPGAHPDCWWGLRPLSSVASVSDHLGTVGPVRLTASSLDALLACPRKWYLERRVKAQTVSSEKLSVGNIVHSLADHLARGDVKAHELSTHVDRIWGKLAFAAEWQSIAKRAEIDLALERLVVWHEHHREQLVGTEVCFSCEIVIPGDTVLLEGRVDRLEHDDQGRLVVVDVKTKSSPFAKIDVEQSAQLGFYQLAITAGAFGDTTVSGGAEYVLPFVPESKAPELPRTQRQLSLSETGTEWMVDKISTAAGIMRAGTFPATQGKACTYCTFVSSCPTQESGKQVLP